MNFGIGLGSSSMKRPTPTPRPRVRPRSSTSTLQNDENASVQLLSFHPETHHVKINEDALTSLIQSCHNNPICVVCVTGTARSGKSLLSCCIKQRLAGANINTSNGPYRYNGFNFQPGHDTITQGVWVHKTAFIVDGYEGDIAVILMDTEGVDEVTPPEKLCAILGLSLLLSNIIIYSELGDPSPNPFLWLSQFLSENSPMKFQTLSYLIHDWTRLQQHKHGAVPKSSFDSLLNINHQLSHIVKNSFSDCNSFLLPQIGEEAQTRQFGIEDDLNLAFRDQLGQYLKEILNPKNLLPKKMLDNSVTPSDFEHFFRSLVDHFNKRTDHCLYPTAASILHTITQTAGQIKLNRGIKTYENRVNQRRNSMQCRFFRRMALDTLNMQARTNAVEEFTTFRLSPQDENDLQQKLEQELNNMHAIMKASNKEAWQSWKNQLIQGAIERLTNAVEQRFQFYANESNFHDDNEVKTLIEQTEAQILQDFGTETAKEDHEELPQVREMLIREFKNLSNKYLQINQKNKAQLMQGADTQAEEFFQGYKTSMNDRQRHRSNVTLDMLQMWHEFEVEKLKLKLEKLNFANRDYQKNWERNLLQQVETEFEVAKLNLTAKEEEALQYIADEVAQYKNELRTMGFGQSADDMQRQHQQKTRDVVELLRRQNFFSRDERKQDDLEVKMKRELNDAYEKIVQGELLQNRQHELGNLIIGCLEEYKRSLQDTFGDNTYFGEEELQNIFGQGKDNTLGRFRQNAERIGIDRSTVENETHKLMQQFKETDDIWERRNADNRQRMEADADKILNECVSAYETNVTGKINKLPSLQSLKDEHEKERTKAVEHFTQQFEKCGRRFLEGYIHKMELRIDEMSLEIEDLFNMKQKKEDVGLQSAITDAQAFYEENMKKRMNTSNNGYFDDDSLDTMDMLLQEGAIKNVTAKLPLTPEQKKKVKEALRTSFNRVKADNNVVKKSFDAEDLAIGIDLGTTYCCVAAFQNGKVKIVRNSKGTYTTPSYVLIAPDGSTTVGHVAKQTAHKNPEATIFDAKRIIGKRMDDEKLREDMQLWPFNVEEVQGRCKIKVYDKYYSPEEISSYILRHLRKEAEQFLGKKVTKAVITVPAYFTDAQRQATMDAGEVAGLEVLGILNEPTAAAFAYRLDSFVRGRPRNILVYDLGGGTFDVAVLKISDNKIDVLSIGGDSHLGGEDFDQNLMRYCAQQLGDEHEFDLFEGKDSAVKKTRDEARRKIKRLQLRCEDTKKELADARVSSVSIDEIAGDIDVDLEITRKTFDNLNRVQFQRTIKIVEDTLRSSKVRKEDIDDVVLIGGSTRIVLLQEMLENFFGGKALNKQVNPDEAVAYGAAVQAALLNAQPGTSIFDFGKVNEVMPMALGIELANGEMDVLIEKNEEIPTEVKQVYRTSKDNQQEVSIRIYQGEDSHVSNNKLLGKFAMHGIPPAPAEKEAVEIIMSVDKNGIVKVEAMCLSTMEKCSVVVSENGSGLTREEKKRLLPND